MKNKNIKYYLFLYLKMLIVSGILVLLWYENKPEQFIIGNIDITELLCKNISLALNLTGFIWMLHIFIKNVKFNKILKNYTSNITIESASSNINNLSPLLTCELTKRYLNNNVLFSSIRYYEKKGYLEVDNNGIITKTNIVTKELFDYEIYFIDNISELLKTSNDKKNELYEELKKRIINYKEEIYPENNCCIFVVAGELVLNFALMFVFMMIIPSKVSNLYSQSELIELMTLMISITGSFILLFAYFGYDGKNNKLTQNNHEILKDIEYINNWLKNSTINECEKYVLIVENTSLISDDIKSKYNKVSNHYYNKNIY